MGDNVLPQVGLELCYRKGGHEATHFASFGLTRGSMWKARAPLRLKGSGIAGIMVGGGERGGRTLVGRYVLHSDWEMPNVTI